MAEVVRVVCVIAFATGGFLLHGCGGGGTTTTTTSTHSPNAPPTVAPTAGPTAVPTKAPTVDPDYPMTAEAAAKKFNDAWKGFDESDDNSPLGIHLSMGSATDSFFKNLFCHEYLNPVTNQHTGCHVGGADCRLSTFLANHKVAVHKTTGHMMPAMDRKTGYIFDPEQVVKMAKCSYIWDGATQNKYNNGCGDGAGAICPPDEGSEKSAYVNKCGDAVCTANSTEVKRGFCQGYGGDHPIPDVHNGNYMCAIPSANIDYHGQKISTFAPNKADNLREMMKERIKRNGGTDKEGPNIQMWNEVVFDVRLLVHYMQIDPARLVQAFVCVKGDSVSLSMAKKMRDEFVRVMNVTKPIPILAMGQDTEPFSPGETDELVV